MKKDNIMCEKIDLKVISIKYEYKYKMNWQIFYIK